MDASEGGTAHPALVGLRAARMDDGMESDKDSDSEPDFCHGDVLDDAEGSDSDPEDGGCIIDSGPGAADGGTRGSEGEMPTEEGEWAMPDTSDVWYAPPFDDPGVKPLPDPSEEGWEEALKDPGNVGTDLTPLTCFLLLLPCDMWDDIVTLTNITGYQRRQRLIRRQRKHKQQVSAAWKELTTEELFAWVGITFAMGIMSLPNLAMYWSNQRFGQCLPSHTM